MHRPLQTTTQNAGTPLLISPQRRSTSININKHHEFNIFTFEQSLLAPRILINITLKRNNVFPTKAKLQNPSLANYFNRQNKLVRHNVLLIWLLDCKMQTQTTIVQNVFTDAVLLRPVPVPQAFRYSPLDGGRWQVFHERQSSVLFRAFWFCAPAHLWSLLWCCSPVHKNKNNH